MRVRFNDSTAAADSEDSKNAVIHFDASIDVLVVKLYEQWHNAQRE